MNGHGSSWSRHKWWALIGAGRSLHLMTYYRLNHHFTTSALLIHTPWDMEEVKNDAICSLFAACDPELAECLECNYASDGGGHFKCIQCLDGYGLIGTDDACLSKHIWLVQHVLEAGNYCSNAPFSMGEKTWHLSFSERAAPWDMLSKAGSMANIQYRTIVKISLCVGAEP